MQTEDWFLLQSFSLLLLSYTSQATIISNITIIYNSPVVAGAVLLITLWLINWLIKGSFSSKSSKYHKSQTVIASDFKILWDKIHHHLCETCHMSCVKSHVICHVSHSMCHISCVTVFNLLYIFSFWNKWWSLLVEGLLSTGPTLYSFYRNPF